MPKHNIDTIIQSEIDNLAEKLEERLEASIISFNGPLTFGIDDYIREAIEYRASAENAQRNKLAFIITTAGGYIEVVHRVVDTIRHFYPHVTFIIPNYAYSAGTVLVMSGDEIYMDYYSRLGPIDPQVQLENGHSVPALGYLKQWESLRDKAQDGKISQVEAQLFLYGFDQAELYKYAQERDLSITLLKEWLVKYKFKNWRVTQTRGKRVTNKMRQARAVKIAGELNNTDRWHSHGYGISMDVLQKDLKLVINDFGADIELAKLIKEYYTVSQDYINRHGGGSIHTKNYYLPLEQ